MIRMRLSEAAAVTGGERVGADVEFEGAGIDSRRIARGALFVALPGERVDGHAFVDDAAARGAAAALVSRPVDARLPRLVVDEGRAGLGRLAAAWRARFAVPVVAVTGSNGKTTVKEMLAAVLRRRGPVLATRGNLNNDIGLPLTLLELDAQSEAAVVELGANHPGEIARLAELARPRVGVITQCAPAHLEGFGSVEGVARAKGELLEGVDADGVCVVNADDRFAPLWRDLAGARRCLTFGLEAPADVSAETRPGEGGQHLHVRTPRGDVDLLLPLPGRHNAANALAAVAAALALDVPLASVADGLSSMQPVAGRLQSKAGHGGARVIDDTYNANPASLRAGLEVLAGCPGAHWLVLGDMAELGGDARSYHEAAGRMARELGVERLWATGELTRATADVFGDGASHFGSRQELIEALVDALPRDATVLVKGSRSMGMERVVAALTAGPEATEEVRGCC